VTGHPDGTSNDIDVKYHGAGAELTLLVNGLTVNGPRTDRMTIVFTIAGMTFSAHSGDCTLTLTRFEYLASHVEPSRLVPSFAGTLSCSGIADIRSGDELALNGAFDY
jgi:hypothetical protein